MEEISATLPEDDAESVARRIYGYAVDLYDFAETFRRILGDVTHAEWHRIQGINDVAYLDVLYDTSTMSYEEMLNEVGEAYPRASLSAFPTWR